MLRIEEPFEQDDRDTWIDEVNDVFVERNIRI